MAYRARFAQAGHVTDTPGPSGVPGSRLPVQPPGVRTGAFTRPAHAHMYMHMSSLYMYMTSLYMREGQRRAERRNERQLARWPAGRPARRRHAKRRRAQWRRSCSPRP